MANSGILDALLRIWPFYLIFPARKIKFCDGIPIMPSSKRTFEKLRSMSVEEIEAIEINPQLEQIFSTFAEMSDIILRDISHDMSCSAFYYNVEDYCASPQDSTT